MPQDDEIEQINTTEPTSASSSAPSIDVHGARFETLVESAAWGEASAEDLAILEAHNAAWQRVLVERLNDTDEALDRLRLRRSPDDQQVIADLENEQRKLELALDRLLGIEPEVGELTLGVNALQLSWVTGRRGKPRVRRHHHRVQRPSCGPPSRPAVAARPREHRPRQHGCLPAR